jgi:hypothetical protein
MAGMRIKRVMVHAEHADTDYRPTPGLPLVPFFTCARLHASLTVTSCASRWREAANPHADRYSACRACPVGAAHSGIANASLSPLRGTLMCSRCQRGQMRLIRGDLCVSCYNREREVIMGRNARGMIPTKLAKLEPRTICYSSNGRVTIARTERTAGVAELLVATLRDAAYQVAFGWRGSRAQLRQGRLF